MIRLNGREKQLQKYAIKMAREKFNDYTDCRHGLEDILKEKLTNLYQEGYFKMHLCKEYEGLGLTLKEGIIILKEIAKIDPQLAHLIAGVNYGVNYPIYLYGTSQQKEKYLKEKNKKLLLGLLAFNEPNGAGYNQIATKAKKIGAYYYLSGTKAMITNAVYADYGIIIADVVGQPHNYTAFIIDLKDNPDIKISRPETTMGLECVKVSDIEINHLKVHESNVLGKEGEGFKVVTSSMEYMRLAIATVSFGIAEKSYEETMRYIKQRTISEKPMFELQAIKFKMADIKIKLEMMQHSILGALNQIERCKTNQILNTSMVKYFVTENAKQICDTCLQLFGGMGYISNTVIEKLYRDIRLMPIIGGTSETILEMVSKSIMNK